MGILADRLNTMTVRVMSPDATVRLYLTGGGQLHIEFAKGCLNEHTESSLATQLGHVFTKALRRQRHDMAKLVRETISEMDVDEDDTFRGTSPTPPPAPRARRIEAAAASITALGRSPRSCVTIRRIPGEIMDVKVRKGTLQRFSGEEVTVEVHAALNAVSADHQRQLTQLRREIFDSVPSDRQGG